MYIWTKEGVWTRARWIPGHIFLVVPLQGCIGEFLAPFKDDPLQEKTASSPIVRCWTKRIRRAAIKRGAPKVLSQKGADFLGYAMRQINAFRDAASAKWRFSLKSPRSRAIVMSQANILYRKGEMPNEMHQCNMLP
jgi:hypothetical protein